MKTKQQMIQVGYPEDWATECPNCKSWDCHEYADGIQCFDCKYHEYFSFYYTPERDRCFIIITPEMKKIAEIRADRTMKEAYANNLKSRFQTDERKNKFTGFLGELIWLKWLGEAGIKYERKEVYGRPDEADTVVNGKIIDVKTGHRIEDINNIKDNFTFGVLKEQLQKPSDFYISVLIDKDIDKAVIMGFCSYELVKELQDDINEMNYVKIPYSRLNRIIDFKEAIK